MQNGSGPRSPLERFCRRGSVRKLPLLWALDLDQIFLLGRLVVPTSPAGRSKSPHPRHTTRRVPAVGTRFAAGLHPHPEHLRVLLAVTRGAVARSRSGDVKETCDTTAGYYSPRSPSPVLISRGAETQETSTSRSPS